jgi:hypothetical protein
MQRMRRKAGLKDVAEEDFFCLQLEHSIRRYPTVYFSSHGFSWERKHIVRGAPRPSNYCHRHLSFNDSSQKNDCKASSLGRCE